MSCQTLIIMAAAAASNLTITNFLLPAGGHQSAGAKGEIKMEIIERKKGRTLWRWRDAEGRYQYAQTSDWKGVAIEPSRCTGHCTKKGAIREANNH